MKPIGVFDSGIGGKSVADAIEREFPDREVVFVNDPEHLPYGTKSPDEMESLVKSKMDYLISRNCEVIVIACNTVTTNIIERLRADYPVPFIGMEPMVKPAAALTKTGVITICATPSTLSSARYAWLKKEFADGITVIEPNCSDWTRMIEDNNINESKIREIIDSSCDNGSDVIVLGCTHYHWIEELIRQLANGRAQIIQPESAIIKRLEAVLGRSS